VLAIRAEPPEVPAGGTSQVTILAVEPSGAPIQVTWSRCRLPPRTGEAVNPGCVDRETAPYLEPLGTGMTIAAQMPALSAADLGQPDATNGVYLPLVARATSGTQSVTAVYRLRLAGAAPPNTNPTIASVVAVDGGGTATTLDEAAPLIVDAGDELTLEAILAPGSAESYMAFGGKSVTETLRTSWFTTAGELSVDRTSAEQPRTVLRLGEPLPSPGKIIDLFAVAHDERGGVGYTHRSLELR
jgi:hypothetical protein